MSSFVEGFLESGSIARRVIDGALFLLSSNHADELVSSGQFLTLIVLTVVLMMVLTMVRSFLETSDSGASNNTKGVRVIARGVLSVAIMYLSYLVLRIFSRWIGLQMLDGPWRFTTTVQVMRLILWVLCTLVLLARYRSVSNDDLMWTNAAT
jgi:hypothetical protein